MEAMEQDSSRMSFENGTAKSLPCCLSFDAHIANKVSKGKALLDKSCHPEMAQPRQRASNISGGASTAKAFSAFVVG